jgi:hypothetical protein
LDFSTLEDNTVLLTLEDDFGSLAEEDDIVFWLEDDLILPTEEEDVFLSLDEDFTLLLLDISTSSASFSGPVKLPLSSSQAAKSNAIAPIATPFDMVRQSSPTEFRDQWLQKRRFKNINFPSEIITNYNIKKSPEGNKKCFMDSIDWPI